MGTYVRGQMVTVDNFQLLSTGKIKILGRLVDASNASLLCEISDGVETCQAIYKPIAGERPLWDFSTGNLASREVAAYLVSESLNLDVVPLTILRDGPYGLGSLQLWLNDCEEVGERYLERSQGLRKIALLDAVINNTDRKIGHLLYKDDEIFGCDHGVTFHEEYKLRTVLWQFADLPLSDHEIQTLRDFNCQLENLINDSSKRIDNLLNTGKFPLPPTDWPAIPWPPF